MGMSICALYINVEETSEGKITSSLENLYGQFFKIYEKWDNEIKGLNLIFRSVSFYDSGIILWDDELAMDIIAKQSQESVNKIYNLFDQPTFMLAFMHYDSGDSFGFSYIEKNEIVRYRYDLSNEIGHKEYGKPLEEEKSILEGEFYELDDGEKLYKRTDDIDNPRSYHFICSELANEVMKAKIGFDLYSDESIRNSKIFTFKQKNEKDRKKNVFNSLRNLFKGK